ncbi:hypothetical protein LWT81_21200 [Enterobacter hormaechei]|nr:hypothetical protein [Enterobacter hormaechei]MCE1566611.1 hypothetical protein [Enterobacter hormaechei]HAV1885499.1 hypothetical protein [Enterobacter hormaechei subsp. xiangfangensis]
MQFGTFQTMNGNNAFSRYKVVAHASNALLQDKLVKLTDGIASDLIVGDLVTATGAKAAAAADIAFVMVEPAFAGDTAIVVANPVHVIISKLGIEFNSMNETAVIEKLEDLGFTFTDYSTVALRTT